MRAIASAEGAPADGPIPALVFRFDRADGYWLQGYSNFLMAQADFWLAHDFRSAFDQTFHMLFPGQSCPCRIRWCRSTTAIRSMFGSEWRIADMISFIHLINWPVVEPERARPRAWNCSR